MKYVGKVTIDSSIIVDMEHTGFHTPNVEVRGRPLLGDPS
jgi:hypothetical protein